ncbi:hypothetical protein DL93DRAFT_1146634 [Clavulina sp. PMI_390]|nr:hypothetical protein DL93DRAFT_1146634 [Clavulina sp. PMI_390]
MDAPLTTKRAMSPVVHRLPSEVLLEIFHHVTKPDERLSTIFIGASMLAEINDVDEYEVPEAKRANPVVNWRLLLWTCRRWHSEAMGDARLWAQVVILDKPWPNFAMVRVFLNRSKNTKLDVHVHIIRRTDSRAYTVPTFHSILGSYSHRIRSLRYGGGRLEFFPSPFPTPHLKHLLLQSPRFNDYDIPNQILQTLTPLHSFHLGWNQPNPFYLIDPDALQDLSIKLDESWNYEYDRAFLLKCTRLKSLALPQESIPYKIDGEHEPFSFPLLEKLFLHDPCWAFGPCFDALPNLRCLAVLPNQTNYDDYRRKPRSMKRFGSVGDIPAIPWPTMPSLQMMVVDHVHAADLIPTLQSSPELGTIHLQAGYGFVEFLRGLCGSSVSATPILPQLADLRLWGASLDGGQAIGSRDDLADVMDALDDVLDQYPTLHVAIGCPVPLKGWMQGKGYRWNGQWSLPDLRPYQEECLRNRERVSLIEDIPFVSSLELARSR